MDLTLSPEEALALHDLLTSHVGSSNLSALFDEEGASGQPPLAFAEGPAAEGHRGRSGPSRPPHAGWFRDQQAKIERLELELHAAPAFAAEDHEPGDTVSDPVWPRDGSSAAAGGRRSHPRPARRQV